MLLDVLSLLLVLVLQCTTTFADDPEFYPMPKDYKPVEWDHYPLNPEPYPAHKRPPAPGLWPPARTLNQWRIDGLNTKKSASSGTIKASFNIYRTSWQVCVDDLGPILWQPCGWQLDKGYMKCSSDFGRSTNGWYTCDEHLYTLGGNTTIEKNAKWIKWRFLDLNAGSPTSSPVKIQFIHAAPLEPCTIKTPEFAPICEIPLVLPFP